MAKGCLHGAITSRCFSVNYFLPCLAPYANVANLESRFTALAATFEFSVNAHFSEENSLLADYYLLSL